MRVGLTEVIENIGYSKVHVILDMPVVKGSIVLDIDHVSETEYGYYLEDSEGNSFEISKGSEVELYNGSYYITKDNCQICIKLDV